MDFKLAITINKRELGVTAGRSVALSSLLTVVRKTHSFVKCHIYGHRVLHNISTM